MKITEKGVDRVITLIAGISATLLPVLVDNNVITIQLSVLIGSSITAVVAGFHGTTTASNITKNRIKNDYIREDDENSVTAVKNDYIPVHSKNSVLSEENEIIDEEI